MMKRPKSGWLILALLAALVLWVVWYYSASPLAEDVDPVIPSLPWQLPDSFSRVN